MRKTLASRTMARPMATRWRCPPERSAGLRSKNSFSPRISAASRTRLSISSLLYLRNLRPNAMLS